jgi:hypothetical protein
LEFRYIKNLLTFDYDKKGNIANLSRIDPSLLGVKDANGFPDALHLHGLSSTPLTCFSLVLVIQDNHQHPRALGSEWVQKDIFGVLHAMELERLVAVLGLAYDLPYVEDDGARRDCDLLRIQMIKNGFAFSTRMMSANGEHSLDVFHGQLCHLYFVLEYNKATGKAGITSRLMSTPKRASMSTPKQASTSSTPKQKQASASSSNFFASSPSISSKQGTSSSTAKNSLQATDTGMAVSFFFKNLFPLIHTVQSLSMMGGRVSLMFPETL